MPHFGFQEAQSQYLGTRKRHPSQYSDTRLDVCVTVSGQQTDTPVTVSGHQADTPVMVCRRFNLYVTVLGQRTKHPCHIIQDTRQDTHYSIQDTRHLCIWTSDNLSRLQCPDRTSVTESRQGLYVTVSGHRTRQYTNTRPDVNVTVYGHQIRCPCYSIWVPDKTPPLHYAEKTIKSQCPDKTSLSQYNDTRQDIHVMGTPQTISMSKYLDIRQDNSIQTLHFCQCTLTPDQTSMSQYQDNRQTIHYS